MWHLYTRLLTLVLLTFNLQCHWRQPPPTDTLIVALASEPKTLDPRFTTDANGQRIAQLIFSSLVQIGSDLNMTGDAAESWDYKDLVYTFKLKPGIRFQNGDLLTSEDLYFSVEEFKKSSSPFSPMMNVIQKVEANYSEQGGQLKLFLKEFSAPFLNDLTSLKLLSKKITEEAGDDFYLNPVGTGTYSYKSRDHNNIYLETNPYYFAEKSKSPKLQFKIIKDANTRFQKMYKGQVDIIQSDIPFSKVQVFKDLEKFNVVIAPGLSTTYILLNLRNDILKNPDVRRAIHSAISRDELIKYSFEGLAEPATAIITKVSPFHNENLKDEVYSEEQISKIFSKYKDKTIILKTSNQMSAIENGKIIAHQLRKRGLNIQMQSYEWGTYYEDIRTGKFEMAIMKWVGINDPDIYRVSLHSAMVPPGRNRGYYDNKIFDKIVYQGLIEPDFTKRKQLYDQAQSIVFKDLPTIPLWYEKQVAIVHKRVKNYSLPVTGNFSSLTRAFKEDDGN